MQNIPFSNTYSKLPEQFYTRQNPASVPEPALIRVNEDLADELGIDSVFLNSDEGVQVFSGNQVPEGADPIAQVYAGHQFGGYSPQLGDGRAILLGEVVDQAGRQRDLQLKGSGRTAFSRGGDGKSALGPVIREYIVSEAMYALGVRTTRALSAVRTGETVRRHDGKRAGGVFTRVASSHIRVGTFQYFYAHNDISSVRLLADYAMKRHYPHSLDSEEPYLEFFTQVARAQVDLIAHWMSLGFIHGVMNTDNMAISGETIDYGPCAFMDAFHPQCVFSSIDTGGRYAWGSQPNIGLWNMSRFAETLVPLVDEDQDKAVEKIKGVLEKFPEWFSDAYAVRFRSKFGLSNEDDMIKSGLGLLAKQEVDFTLFFRRLTQVAAGDDVQELAEMFSDQKSFQRWFDRWKEVMQPSKLADMQSANPIYIPRNHRVEQAIASAYDGDDEPFHRLVELLKNPFTEQDDAYEKPPLPEERVRETFCGT